MTPDILIVGHIAKDIADDGWRAGGSVYYAAAQAQRLGLRVAAVTACSDDLNPAQQLPGVGWAVAPDSRTTTFQNLYQGSDRRQRVLAQARPLTLDDVPQDWRQAPIVLLTPLLQEIDAETVRAFAGRAGLLVCGAQGWLRTLDGEDVVPATPDASIWRGCNLLFLSEEDLIDITSIRETREPGQTIVQTRAGRGCSLWDDSGRHDLPALAANEVDPTGAGDVFTAAFLVRKHETGSNLEAARFASAAAALSVEGHGIETVGDRAAIEARLAAEKVAR